MPGHGIGVETRCVHGLLWCGQSKAGPDHNKDTIAKQEPIKGDEFRPEWQYRSHRSTISSLNGNGIVQLLSLETGFPRTSALFLNFVHPIHIWPQHLRYRYSAFLFVPTIL